MAAFLYFQVLIATVAFVIASYFSRRGPHRLMWRLLKLQAIFSHKHPHDVVAKFLEKSKGTVLMKGPWLTNISMMMTCDPANLHYIMSKKFSNYPKGPEWRKTFDLFGDHGVFNSDFDEWRSQAKSLRKFLNHPKLHQFFMKITQNGLENGLIPVLDHASREKLVIDFQDVIKRLYYDTSCMMATGYSPNLLQIGFPKTLLIKAYDDACEAIFFRSIEPESLWKLQRWLGVGKEKNLSMARETLHRFFEDQMSMRYKTLRMNTHLDGDGEETFDALRGYHDPSFGVSSTDDETVRDNLIGFVFAGADTTSTTLSWFFWLISKNKHVQLKIREEIDKILEDKGTSSQRLVMPRLEEISKMVYLHAALCETLRLHPSVPFEQRSPVEEDVLPSGHKVLPNTKIVLSIYALGRMKSVWGEDCSEFKPERWINEEGGIKQEPSSKFFAFNAGPRSCPGKELAFVQLKATAASIIHNYDVQVVEGQTATANASIILSMKDGLMVTVRRRTG